MRSPEQCYPGLHYDLCRLNQKPCWADPRTVHPRYASLTVRACLQHCRCCGPVLPPEGLPRLVPKF